MIYTLGPHRVLAGHISIPWGGCWIASLTLDPDIPADPPDGAKLPLVLGDGGKALGTVDGSRSGSFAGIHKCTIVGGLGWSRELPPQHFTAPALLSPAVIAATAASVLEVATVVAPIPIGEDGHYVRNGGTASKVLDGLDWFVGLDGVTMVGPRIPKPVNPLESEILNYDPETGVVDIAGTAVIEPGALIAPDPLRGLTELLTVRSVEIDFGPAGFHTRAKCGDAPTEPGIPLIVALRKLMRELAKNEFNRLTRYRVVGPGPEDGTWLLQAVELGEKADVVGAKLWPGLQGLSAKLFPSSIVLVAFGTNQDPMIVGSDESLPLEVSIDAAMSVSIGGESALPLIQAPGLSAAITAAATAANGIGGPVSGSALATILNGIVSALGGATTVKTKAA